MNDSVNPTTAKAKLALSRTALLGAMGYERVKDAVEDTQMSGTVRAIHTPARPSALRSRISQSVLGRWWQRHPMSSVVELGQPFLQHYAQRNPGKLSPTVRAQAHSCGSSNHGSCCRWRPC